MKNKNSLKGKSVLFFCVKLFDYEVDIKNELVAHGAEVHYYDERPKNNVLSKVLIRLRSKAISGVINKYYKDILAKMSKISLDYLLVVKGELIPGWFIDEIRKQNKNIKLIYYTWDSFDNNKHALSILKYFDKKFTFDISDATKYSLTLRPLFYNRNYYNLNQQESYKNDVLFIGTAHSDRYVFVEKIKKQLSLDNLKMYTYYFLPSKVLFVYNKITNKSFKAVSYSDISFDSIGAREVSNLVSHSHCILDIQHPNQTGLTMRTLETIGARRKLITTNRDIEKYSFYNKNNILIVDRTDPEIPSQFLKSEIEEINEEHYNRLSISGWLQSVFFEKNEKWLNDNE